MNSLFPVDGGVIKKQNGINKSVVESIRHKVYVDMFFGRGLVKHNIKMIQSQLHAIGTGDIFKIYLLCFYVKVIFLIMMLVDRLIFIGIY